MSKNKEKKNAERNDTSENTEKHAQSTKPMVENAVNEKSGERTQKKK